MNVVFYRVILNCKLITAKKLVSHFILLWKGLCVQEKKTLYKIYDNSPVITVKWPWEQADAPYEMGLLEVANFLQIGFPPWPCRAISRHHGKISEGSHNNDSRPLNFMFDGLRD